MNESDFLNASLRGRLLPFIQRSFQTVSAADRFLSNWHIEAIAWHLEECRRGNIKRLIVTLPPRSGKSISASVAFAAWLLGHEPTCRIIAASYALPLAAKHARDCRTVMESNWFGKVFPKTRLARDKNTETLFHTTDGGFRYSTSVGASITGFGGDYIIIDDPMKADDAMSESARAAVWDWYKGVLYSRLNNKTTGVIIVIMQRLHEEDLVGWLRVTEPDGWKVLDLPAIAEIPQAIPIGPGMVHQREPGDVLHPAHEPREELMRTKARIGTSVFSAQYQQNPIPAEGDMIKREWLRFFDVVPKTNRYSRIVNSWDTASKVKELHDYSVCTTWLIVDDQCYLLDVFRERLNYPDLKYAVIDRALKSRASHILIEDRSSGTALLQDIYNMQNVGFPETVAISPGGDKIMRMHAQTAKFEAGHVLLPKNAPWLDGLLKELLGFPGGRHDDQVDSISQLLAWHFDRPAYGGTSGYLSDLGIG